MEYYDKTDQAINDYVEYAVLSGSNNADMYFTIIRRVVKTSLFIVRGKVPFWRECLNDKQREILEQADAIVVDEIREGINNKMEYKSIYLSIKERLAAYAKKVGVHIVDGKVVNQLTFDFCA